MKHATSALQIAITITAVFLALLTLLESWFFINVNPLGMYFIVLFVLIIIFLFTVLFLFKIKKLEATEANFIDTLKKFESNYLTLQVEKNKILSIITSFSDGILILKNNGTIDIINSQAERILGVLAKEVLHKPLLDLEVHFPRINTVGSLLLSDVKYSFTKELKIEKDLIIQIHVNPLFVKREYMGKLIIFHDITKEKVVAEMKTDFISSVVHQLNGPLSAMKLSLEMLLHGDFGKMRKEQKEVIEKLNQKNKVLVTLVGDLLSMARIEERYSYHYTPVDLEGVIHSVVALNKDEIEIKKITYKFEKSKAKFPKIMLDKEKINLVIQNLFENAIKYTHVRGKITISLKEINGNAELAIKDSGIGIPESQQKKLFTKFFRGTNATKLHVVSSGLGLFIAKNIVEAHKGKIWCKSKEGKGSIFFISIPMRRVDSVRS